MTFPFSSEIEEHLPKCSYSGQPDTSCNHKWSGWPGAYCLKCGAGDPAEACMGGCKCTCHAGFWKEYEEQCVREQNELQIGVHNGS